MNDIKDQIVAGTKSGEFLKTVCDIYLSDREYHDKLSRALSSLQNNGTIDVVAEFRKLKNSNKEHDFFMTRHIFESLLPHNIEVDPNRWTVRSQK